jgi:hypothetical protein
MALGEGEVKTRPWRRPGHGPRGREGEEEKRRSHGEGGVASAARRGGWFCPGARGGE